MPINFFYTLHLNTGGTMKRALIALVALFALSGCSRNGEYIYLSQLNLIEPPQTLIPKLRDRLGHSAFRENYDQNLTVRIGSSFKNFKHIRAYQALLEDALIYVMARTNMTVLDESIRNAVVPPISKLILSRKSGEELLLGLDKIVRLIDEMEGPALTNALSDYDAQLKAEGE